MPAGAVAPHEEESGPLKGRIVSSVAQCKGIDRRRKEGETRWEVWVLGAVELILGGEAGGARAPRIVGLNGRRGGAVDDGHTVGGRGHGHV